MTRSLWCVPSVMAVLLTGGCGGGETPPETRPAAQGVGPQAAPKVAQPAAQSPSQPEPKQTAPPEPPAAQVTAQAAPQAAEQAGQPAGDALGVVRAVECRWRDGPIKIDGVLNEKAWDGAQTLDNFVVFWQKRKAKTATTARLLWDDRYLYFSAEMEDADLYADVKEFNGMTWTNDVFELFFKPSKNALLYYEFQVNALNTQLELLLPSRGAGGYQRFGPLTKLGMESAVKLRGTLNKWDDKDTGWTVEGRIPWKAFELAGGRPEPGARWHFALCRYDYSVAFDRPDLSSTAALTQPDFHRYEDYSELTFKGP